MRRNALRPPANWPATFMFLLPPPRHQSAAQAPTLRAARRIRAVRIRGAASVERAYARFLRRERRRTLLGSFHPREPFYGSRRMKYNGSARRYVSRMLPGSHPTPSRERRVKIIASAKKKKKKGRRKKIIGIDVSRDKISRDEIAPWGAAPLFSVDDSRLRET